VAGRVGESEVDNALTEARYWPERDFAHGGTMRKPAEKVLPTQQQISFQTHSEARI
jgi:hypothetical protein